MSDFMMSQVQGLVNKVADDLDRMGKTSNSQFDSILGAIDDLAANIFATQAVLAILLKKHPIDAAEARKWIADQTGDAGTTPKANAIIDILTKRG
ncbi:MAG: hypothetical protein FJX59_20435 [Alphaproteobacteria bacterium]|nr:hypothetical protein [Alphaproteobacteria bacterium]